jgi:acetyltransferase
MHLMRIVKRMIVRQRQAWGNVRNMQAISDALVVRALDAAGARDAMPALVALLRDAVAGGASVGFLSPLRDAVAEAFWAECIAAVATGDRILLVAQRDGEIVGTVQLDLARKLNAYHRAEVQKLLVASSQRRQGIGEALMRQVEQTARHHNRTLLVLDTLAGCDAERLYRRLGYQEVGRIPGYVYLDGGNQGATVVFYRTLADAAAPTEENGAMPSSPSL